MILFVDMDGFYYYLATILNVALANEIILLSILLFHTIKDWRKTKYGQHNR